MKNIPLYQVDAFTDHAFGGNPAAVCLLDDWLPDALLQSIALENNLSETAFLVPKGPGRYHLRWFTPVDEVDLCGHATLASAHVVFTHADPGKQVIFDTRSGPLTVVRRGAGYEMDFPARTLTPYAPPGSLLEALGAEPVAAIENQHLVLLELASPAAVRGLRPNFTALKAAEERCVVVTARGDEQGVDFISRFFAPCHDINEDPVTGSAHCSLTPYWAAKLGKTEFTAVQVSARRGDLECDLVGDRVLLRGQAVEVLSGTLRI